MPEYALIKTSTGALQRIQSFDGTAPVLSPAKDLSWLPVETKAVAHDAPPEDAIQAGKFIREQRAARPLTADEVRANTYAAIPLRDMIEAILDHIDGKPAAVQAILAKRPA